MVDVVVFNVLIPCTDDATGLVHSPSKFDGWVQCGGQARR